jgi:hypothetical protein
MCKNENIAYFKRLYRKLPQGGQKRLVMYLRELVRFQGALRIKAEITKR